MVSGPIRPIILAVDDEPAILESYQLILEDEYEVKIALDAHEALKALQKADVRVVLLDLRLPGIGGLELLRRIKEVDEQVDVAVVSAVNDVETAVKAMKLGAYDYFVKPYEVEDIRAVVRRALERQALVKEVLYLRSEVEQQQSLPGPLGQDAKVLHIFDLVSRVADSDVTILLTGEAGTGKEMLARAIHRQSRRSSKPFVAVKCAGIPEDVVESELFGHERGAFRGATHKRLGKFELAHGGTIFLDEVGSLRADVQVRLLHALQEREIARMGGGRSVKVDTRVIAATTGHLKELVQRQRLREDLYYRLNVVPIHLPPLRARRGDIPLLLVHFVETYNRRFNRDVKGFSSAAMDALQAYWWPGNVAELENIVERLVVITQNEYIQLQELPHDIAQEKEMEQATSTFMSRVSHELRTPLTSIKSFAEILLDELEEMDLAQQKRFLHIINTESERLTRLVTDLLDLQHMGMGSAQWPMAPVSLHAMLQNAVERFFRLAQDKHIRLLLDAVPEELMVYGNEEKLGEVFINLLSNALKFTGRGGEIRVGLEEAKVHPQGRHTIGVIVADTGVGIPREYCQHIFEPFFQVTPPPHPEIGAGLGLSICKEIVEQHGGRLWVESEVGKGSRFYVQLAAYDPARKDSDE